MNQILRLKNKLVSGFKNGMGKAWGRTRQSVRHVASSGYGVLHNIISGTLILGGVLVLALVLLGYDPETRSFNSFGGAPDESWGTSWVALVAGYVGDTVMQILGDAIWLALAPLAALGARRLYGAQASHKIARAFAALFGVLSAALAFTLIEVLTPLPPMPMVSGGVIGYGLYQALLAFYAVIAGSAMPPLVGVVILWAAAVLGVLLILVASAWLRGALRFSFMLVRGVFAILLSLLRGRKSVPQAANKDNDKDNDKAAAAPTIAEPETMLPEVADRPSPPRPSKRLGREAQSNLAFESGQKFELPPLRLLNETKSKKQSPALNKDALESNARLLETVLSDFGVRGRIGKVRPGPVVTLYELELAAGIRTARVVGLADDIARSMSAVSCRVAPVPGANVIGIELPNAVRESVSLREILSSTGFENDKEHLTLALGKDIGGTALMADLTRMPHLLVAGTTGSGKSVGINSMILSLLYRLSPEVCRLILVDPKMLEFSAYDGIPHLLTPVVTEPKKAVVALKWVVLEMENRYRKMAKINVRNIDGFNERMRTALNNKEVLTRRVQTGQDEQSGAAIFEEEEIMPEILPFIVVVIDEMADLMMVAGKEIEIAVQRLAQMARAAGVHLIMATQRPSVDVITGTIKANFPSRISFQVTSKIDSRTVLGEQGGEQLLGQGDMLYMEGGGRIRRVHGAFVSDEEVERVVQFLKKQAAPSYIEQVVQEPDEGAGAMGDSGGLDALYDQAVAIVARDGRASTSYVQRRLQIGYNRAARLIEQMEEQGVISAPNHAGKREVLVSGTE